MNIKTVFLWAVIIGVFPLNANDKGLKKVEKENTAKNYRCEYFRNGTKILGRTKRDNDIVQIIYFKDKPFVIDSKVSDIDNISIHNSLVKGVKYPDVSFERKEGKICTVKLYDDKTILECFNVKNGIIEPVSDVKLKELIDEIENWDKDIGINKNKLNKDEALPNNQLTPQEYNDLLNDPNVIVMSTKQKIFGFSVGESKEGFRIVQVHKNSPADKVGVKTGSILLKIDEKPIAKMSLKEVIELLKTKDNCAFTIKVADGKTEVVKIKKGAFTLEDGLKDTEFVKPKDLTEPKSEEENYE